MEKSGQKKKIIWIVQHLFQRMHVKSLIWYGCGPVPKQYFSFAEHKIHSDFVGKLHQ